MHISHLCKNLRYFYMKGVKKYAYQARQKDVTAHTLRHSLAKNLVNAGTPLDQVAVLPGHESLDTTRIYTQPSERDLERVAKKAASEIVDETEFR